MTLKILHVETGMHLYGGALQVAFLIPGLRARGCRNHLVCPRGSAIAENTHASVDKQHVLPMKGDLDLTFIPRLRRVIRREQPDIIHLHSRRGGDVLGGLAAARLGIPVVMSRRVDNPEDRWVIPLKYRLYDRIITISQGIREVLLSEGLEPSRVVCVHSSVDTDQYRPDTEPQWFREEFGLGPDDITVGMVAQMIPRKGHRDFLAVLPELVAEYPALRVLLFGQGPLREALEREVSDAGLEKHVHFAGFRQDIPRVLPNLDMVVHPAHMEGLGVALLQSAACGVPMVAGRAGGIPEIVRHEINGFLIEPGDIRSLHQAVARLCGNADLRRDMGARGRQIALEDFSIPAMVQGNLDVYRSLVPGETPGVRQACSRADSPE